MATLRQHENFILAKTHGNMRAVPEGVPAIDILNSKMYSCFMLTVFTYSVDAKYGWIFKEIMFCLFY